MYECGDDFLAFHSCEVHVYLYVYVMAFLWTAHSDFQSACAQATVKCFNFSLSEAFYDSFSSKYSITCYLYSISREI